MSTPPARTRSLAWFDAHLDLAYLSEAGRAMDRPVEDAGGPQPGAVTFPALAEGPVQRAFATVFVQPRETDVASGEHADGPWYYTTLDEAHAATWRQLAIYRQWHDAGFIALPDRVPPTGSHPTPSLGVDLLLEGASGVRNLDDLALLSGGGVKILALCWATGSQWAGGDRTGGDVTAAGKTLLREAERLNMTLDVSHLSEIAFWTVMREFGGRKIASHSNCRALLPAAPHPERHLSDAQIKTLGADDGAIGVNLYSKFLVRDRRAEISDVVRHIDHMAQLLGGTERLALGSDMDGGFTADLLPSGLTHPRDLHRLADALSDFGLGDEAIRHFAEGDAMRGLVARKSP